jgi:hypothetical protein
MPKIFVVTSGVYSDYGINAMFSTKELAEKYIDGQIDHDPESYEKASDYNIEEWELDQDHQPQQWVTEYRVNIWLKDGAFVDASESRCKQSENTRGYYFTIGEADSVEKTFSFGGKYTDPPGKSMGVSYKSTEHAMKLAVEGRQAWLRGESSRTFRYEDSNA